MLKSLLMAALIAVAPAVWSAGESAPAATSVSGEVMEVKDAGNYTYLRLKTRNGETWAAIGKAPVKKGAKVTLENVTVMDNFESKTLNRTFKSITFGSLAGAGGSAPHAGPATVNPHTAAVADTAPDAPVAKATGANAWTVAEINTKAGELKEKPVQVRGKVVKFNPGIMGKNWIHLRDGSGSSADRTNDILVTSANAVKLGDVVTARGVVRTDKDFGAGYAFKVLIEEATFQQ